MQHVEVVVIGKEHSPEVFRLVIEIGSMDNLLS